MSDISPEPDVQRTLVHEAEYTAAKEGIFDNARRADNALDGLEFYISRRAEMGMAVRGYDPDEFASWITKPLAEGRVRVVYRFDDTHAVLLDAWLVPEPSEWQF